MNSVSFQVEVGAEDALAFARLSGDWNPLHTDPEHARRTHYRRPVLHGAFSAGLVSRMAGMHLPGADCLLHSLRLNFVAPIIPPARLTVSAAQAGGSEALGRVEVTVSDAVSGTRYVDAVYEYSRHETTALEREPAPRAGGRGREGAPPILVTGASGGLGGAVLSRLGERGLGTSRRGEPGLLQVSDFGRLEDLLDVERIGGIVHCAWPAPDNERLVGLADVASAVDHNLAGPVQQIIALGQLLARRGTPGAPLVLIGSTAALPGRHNYRAPLYSLAKGLIPGLTRVLATELAAADRRCVALTFDVIDGGMNGQLSRATRVAHADRIPSGQLPSLDDAAAQILWVLENASSLISGADIHVTGAAVP
jgi:acyl dehydratase/NAD(P)-dependent dehydrogenase (short-subunit alcohol dehydrogenase family)